MILRDNTHHRIEGLPTTAASVWCPRPWSRLWRGLVRLAVVAVVLTLIILQWACIWKNAVQHGHDTIRPLRLQVRRSCQGAPGFDQSFAARRRARWIPRLAELSRMARWTRSLKYGEKGRIRRMVPYTSSRPSRHPGQSRKRGPSADGSHDSSWSWRPCG